METTVINAKRYGLTFVFLVKIDPTTDGDTSLDQSADLSCDQSHEKLDLSLDESELISEKVFLYQAVPL